MASIALIASDGQVTLPDEIRDELGVGPGDAIEFRVEDHHVVVTSVKKKPFSEFRGIFRVDHALDFKEEREIAWREQTRRLTDENPANRG
jgi:AbrB family looped-hinge helix DNA binding protein